MAASVDRTIHMHSMVQCNGLGPLITVPSVWKSNDIHKNTFNHDVKSYNDKVMYIFTKQSVSGVFPLSQHT